MTQSQQSGYGYYRGGDFTYQAPEASVSREDVKKIVYAADDQGVRISSKYDIWSLGCIFLEVLVFLCEGGPLALEAFVRERRAGDPGTPGYFNSDKGLKSIVTAKLASFRSSPAFDENLTPAQVCLDRTVELIQAMLTPSSHDRPSSEDVYSRLQHFIAVYGFSIGPQDEMRKYIDDPEVPDGFGEVSCEARSFYELGEIQVQSIRDEVPVAGTTKCRIKVYCHKDGQQLMIRRAYKSRGGKMQYVDDNLGLRTACYVPIYIYDPARPTTCAILKSHHPAIYCFASQDDLLRFQAVATRHYLLPEGKHGLEASRIGLRLSVILRKPLGQDLVGSPILAVQTWRQTRLRILGDDRKQSTFSTQSGDSDLSRGDRPAKRSGVVLVIFTKSDGNLFFAIPLHDRSKVLKEGQHHAAVVGNSRHLSIEPAKDRNFRDFGISTSCERWSDGSGYTFPLIQTEVTGYSGNSKFPLTALYAELEFKNRGGKYSTR